MKKLFAILAASILAVGLFAQAPQRMSYQAVIRNSSSVLVTNHIVGMKISILQGAANGISVYTETHTITTNTNGLATIEIGGGTPVTGTFGSIDWANGPYFIKTETDQAGGTNYTISGTSQLLSVPYALHAITAESVTGGIGEADPIYGAWNKSTGISITSSQVSDFQSGVTNNASVLANTAKNSYPAADAAKLAAITGTNTGDQDLSGKEDKTNKVTSISGLSTNLQYPGAKLTYDQLALKVDKVAGKGLSTNDYTTADQTKLAAITGTNTGDQDLSGKVDKVAGKGLSTNDYTTAEQSKLAAITGTNTSDQDLSGKEDKTNKVTSISGLSTNLQYPGAKLTYDQLALKVDKVAGKGLSTNDYTTAEQTKLAAITGTNTGDQDLSGKVDKVAGKGLSTNDYTTAEQSKLAAISGTNTGDQDLSGKEDKTNKVTSISGLSTNLQYPGAKLTYDQLALKVDKVAGKGLSTNDYTTAEQTKLAAITGTNTGDQDLSGKVDKVAGKGLSTNDYTTAEQSKLAAISGTNTGDQDLSGKEDKTNKVTSISGLSTNLQYPGAKLTYDQLALKVDKVAGKGLSTNDYTTAEQTKLAAITGINTGDQDLSGKVDKVAGKGLSTNDYTTADATKLAGIAVGAEVNVNADWNAVSGDAQILNKPTITGTNTGDQDLSGKVDKVAGKGLSTNDYTTAEATKLAGIAVGAEVNVNADWNAVSGDAQILNKPTITGTNTGDQDLSGKVDKVAGKGLSTNDYTTAEQTKVSNLSGMNTGDQTLSGLGGVPTSRTVNGHALTSDVVVTAADVNLGNVTNESKTTMFSSPTFTGTTSGITAAMVGAPTGSGSSTGTNSGDDATNAQYSGLVTNATHTGDATGATALTVVKINGTSLAGLATGILKNTTITGVPSIAIPGTDYIAGLADPSATISLTAVNGTATTAMRSDGAPALDLTIAPLWTGTHNFRNAAYSALFTGGNVGIGTDTPTQKLDVLGNINFSGALMPNNTTGISGQVLTSSGTGTPTWTTLPTVREVADEFTAAVAQTGFTLSQTPSANSKVKMYINGIRISNTAYGITGNVLTYIPANNVAYELVATDRIQFDYYY